MKHRNTLESEFEYYLANQDAIVEKYNGKFVVIMGKHVVGAYPNELDAVNDAKEKYGLGTFLVQLVSAGADEYTEVFHSRVAFN